MRFVVTRTSEYSDEVPPFAGAIKGTIPTWDVRTFKSPEEFDAKFGEREGVWTSRGTDHQIVRGPRGGATGIKRRVGEKTAWFMDLDSLDALVAFYSEHGDLVITDVHGEEGQVCIDIYDDYRE